MRGLTLFRLGRPAEAIPLLEAAHNWTSQTRADPNYVLALCYIDTQNYDNARKAFATQYGFPPDSAPAYLLAARMLLRREYLPIAQQFASKALELDPQLPLAHSLLGEIALAGQHIDVAIAEFEKERLRNPLDGNIYDRLGDAYTRSGDYIKAQQSLQQALLLEPNSTGPYIQLGKVLLKLQDPVNAMMYLERAERMDPGNYITHSLLGQAYRMIGTHRRRHSRSANLPEDSRREPAKARIDPLSGIDTETILALRKSSSPDRDRHAAALPALLCRIHKPKHLQRLRIRNRSNARPHELHNLLQQRRIAHRNIVVGHRVPARAIHHRTIRAIRSNHAQRPDPPALPHSRHHVGIGRVRARHLLNPSPHHGKKHLHRMNPIPREIQLLVLLQRPRPPHKRSGNIPGTHRLHRPKPQRRAAEPRHLRRRRNPLNLQRVRQSGCKRLVDKHRFAASHCLPKLVRDAPARPRSPEECHRPAGKGRQSSQRKERATSRSAPR